MASVMLMMAGCQKDNNDNNGNDNPGNEPGDEPQTELLAPEVISKEIVRLPTGFNTLFVKFHNPNDTYVDYSYDVDFMRNGEVLIQETNLLGTIPSNENRMDWINATASGNIPDNIDEIVVKNIQYGEALYHYVKLNLTKEEKYDNGDLHLVFKAEEQFTVADIYVVFFYVDQIICHVGKSFINGNAGDELECNMETLGENYNRYEIYTLAYR